MKTTEFEKYYKHCIDFYYCTKKVVIMNYYEFFDFVDVMCSDENDDIFSLPVSVLTIEEKSVESIYINRIYDMSMY